MVQQAEELVEEEEEAEEIGSILGRVSQVLGVVLH